MTAAAAFQATFSDWKLIKGRKVVQVVLELPIEHADHAYQALGGMPNPANEIWVAVARLKTETPANVPAAPEVHSDRAGRGGGTNSERRPFASLPLPQQAALLCQDPIFWAFLNEEYNYGCEDKETAAEALREKCQVISRSYLDPQKAGGKVFTELREQFIAWKLVGA